MDDLGDLFIGIFCGFGIGIGLMGIVMGMH